jgi:hypothetical protein
MDQQDSQPVFRAGIGLPVTMTQNLASINGINYHSLALSGESEWGPRQKISDDGLQVTVAQASSRGKGGKPVSIRRAVV